VSRRMSRRSSTRARSVPLCLQARPAVGQPPAGTGPTRRGLSAPTALRWTRARSTALVLPLCSPKSNLPSARARPLIDAGGLSQVPPYEMRIVDALDIRPRRKPALNERLTVQPDGRTSSGIVPDQLAYRLTAPELDAAHCSAAFPRTGKPLVTGMVQSFAPARIRAGGRVAFITTGPVSTLLPAIVRACGPRWCLAMAQGASLSGGGRTTFRGAGRSVTMT